MQQIKIRAKQGFEIPGVEMRVVLEDGTIAPRDGKTAGEFEVKGAWVINSYYKTNNGGNEHNTNDNIQSMYLQIA